MINTVIVLEDSSRVNMGGGQKMTLMTVDILNKIYNLRFVDYSSSSRYAEFVKEKYGEDNFVNIGHISIEGQRGLWIWIKMIISSIIHICYDANKILNKLDPKQCVSYSTNKRTLLMATFLKWRYNIPYIHHAHLVENSNSWCHSVVKWLLAKAFVVICVSKTVIKSINTSNCQLLYNPSVNNGGYKGEKNDNKFVVAFVGSLIPIKGVEYYINAAPLCPQTIEFRIYGDGPLRETLECYSSDQICFMGFENDILNKYYDDIDVLVVPTIIQEALPLVVVDAKSVGLPVIVTTPGGQAEIIDDGINGFHVPVCNSQAIADKINRLYSDRSLYNTISKESFSSFSSFSYKSYKEQIINLFSSIYECVS